MNSILISEKRTADGRRLGTCLIAWVLLFAFTLQSVVTQTHIHNVFDGNGRPTISNMVAEAPPHAKWPSKNDRSSCPLCQAIAHTGAFSTPPTLGFVLPLGWWEIVAVPLTADALDSLSTHPWHSRAPPRR